MSIFENEKSKTSNSRRFLEFHLGEESYCVELLQVKEVITPPELTPIPKTPAYICGLMNLRGHVLTVIDARKKLGITSLNDKSQNAVIIFDINDRLVGAIVDSIQKVLNIPSESIKPVPDEGQDKGVKLLGILQNEQKLSLWIDPESLMDGASNHIKINNSSKVA